MIEISSPVFGGGARRAEGAILFLTLAATPSGASRHLAAMADEAMAATRAAGEEREK